MSDDLDIVILSIVYPRTDAYPLRLCLSNRLPDPYNQGYSNLVQGYATDTTKLPISPDHQISIFFNKPNK